MSTEEIAEKKQSTSVTYHLLKVATDSGVRRKFSWWWVNSVAYGSHLYLVFAACDVTI